MQQLRIAADSNYTRCKAATGLLTAPISLLHQTGTAYTERPCGLSNASPVTVN